MENFYGWHFGLSMSNVLRFVIENNPTKRKRIREKCAPLFENDNMNKNRIWKYIFRIFYVLNFQPSRYGFYSDNFTPNTKSFKS